MSAEYYETALSITANANDIRLAIKALVVDNTPYGWTHVEDWTESSTTWTVLKCPTTSSGLPNDFHVVIAHPQTPASDLCFILCEDYDTTAHRMKRPHVPSVTSFALPSNAGDSIGNDASLYRPTSSGAVRTAGTGISSSLTYQTYSLTNTQMLGIAFYADGMNLAIRNSNALSLYFGKFDSYVKSAATNDPMPIALMCHNHNSAPSPPAGRAWVTRSAMNAGVEALNHNLMIDPISNGLVMRTATSHPANAGSWDKYAENPGPYFEPMILTRGRGETPSLGGHLRGKAKYVLAGGYVTFSWGDTVDVGTDRYMFVGHIGAQYEINRSHWIYVGPVPE